MRAAALQFDVRRGAVLDNLAVVERGLRRAANDGVKLVVLPEMWPTSFPSAETDLATALRETDDCRVRLLALAGELDLVVCGSTFARAEDDGEERLTNRLEVVDGGRPLLWYDKVHLFSPTAEHESFAAGMHPPSTSDSSAGRVSGVVCYDLRFPELTRVPFHDGAEVLCVPAQWPAARAPHFRALVVGLAVLNQCYVVAANRTGRDVIGRRGMELEFPGNSLVVGPNGQVLAEGDGAEGLVTADVDGGVVREMRTRVPVVKDQRPELYATWGAGPPGSQRRRGGRSPNGNRRRPV